MCYQFIFYLFWIFANLIGEKLYLTIVLIWTSFYLRGVWLRCNGCGVLSERGAFPGPRCCGRAQAPDFICHIGLLLPTDGWLGLGCISLERAPRTWLGPWDLTSAGKLPRGLFSSTKDHAVFQLVLYGWKNQPQDGSLQ